MLNKHMELIKSAAYKKTKVYYDAINKHYIKHYGYFDKDWYDEHPKLVDKYYPGNFVSKTCTKDSMTITFHEVEGEPFSRYHMYTNEYFDNVYQWLLKDIDRTWPYTHGDYGVGNIIITPNGTPAMIDFETLSKTRLLTKRKAHNKIHSRFLKGIGKPWHYYTIWRDKNV
jgi:RIO-like serine/threonine protein kinase|tara:strand:- start:1607 stop:2116 length:510 start_codon:yes stop_codon:yes gene_type:complete